MRRGLPARNMLLLTCINMLNLIILGHITRPEKNWPLSRLLKVIRTDIDRSATYDFLLVIRSNHGLSRAVFEINNDFAGKPQISNQRVFNHSLRGSP